MAGIIHNLQSKPIFHFFILNVQLDHNWQTSVIPKYTHTHIYIYIYSQLIYAHTFPRSIYSNPLTLQYSFEHIEGLMYSLVQQLKHPPTHTMIQCFRTKFLNTKFHNLNKILLAHPFSQETFRSYMCLAICVHLYFLSVRGWFRHWCVCFDSAFGEEPSAPLYIGCLTPNISIIWEKNDDGHTW